MRYIFDHGINIANQQLNVIALDEPGAGGANHLYMIEGFDTASNPSDPFVSRHGQPATHATVLFQNGPVGEVGINGITNEALLAVVIDRLRGFQSGQYACRENALALTNLEQAMHWLHHRTRDRTVRGVESTNQV